MNLPSKKSTKQKLFSELHIHFELLENLCSPIGSMIALAYVLILQEKNIIMLDKYDDLTIQDIYKTALNVFSFGKDTTNNLTRRTELFCDIMVIQFAKYSSMYEKDCSEKSRKRLRQDAEGGIDFARHFQRRQLYPKFPNVTPIRATTPRKTKWRPDICN